MEIKGFQKLTLIDYPKKTACIIFLYGCNFRCGYCHNPELVLNSNEESNEGGYTQKEIIDFLKTRTKYLDGVCFTGGEPLMSLDKNFIKEIKQLDYFIKIDTNGSFPEELFELTNAHLIDFVSLDIKISKDKYPDLINSNIDLLKIEQSMKIISELPEYEFRITIIEELHNKDNILEIMKWIESVIGKKIKKFVLQGFKNNGKLIDENFKKYPDTRKEYVLELKNLISKYCDEIDIRV